MSKMISVTLLFNQALDWHYQSTNSDGVDL